MTSTATFRNGLTPRFGHGARVQDGHLQWMIGLLLLGACGGSIPIDYAARPYAKPAQNAAGECYRQARMEVSYGRVHLTNVAAPREGLNVQGAIFYKKGRRLEIERALEEIGASRALNHYRSHREEMRGQANTYEALTWGGMGATVVGLGLLTGGIIMLAGQQDSQRPDGTEQAKSKVPIVLVGGGAVLTLGASISLIPFSITYGNREQQAQAYAALLVDKRLIGDISDHLLAYNRRAAAQCGFRGKVDVPIREGHLR